MFKLTFLDLERKSLNEIVLTGDEEDVDDDDDNLLVPLFFDPVGFAIRSYRELAARAFVGLFFWTFFLAMVV